MKYKSINFLFMTKIFYCFLVFPSNDADCGEIKNIFKKSGIKWDNVEKFFVTLRCIVV